MRASPLSGCHLDAPRKAQLIVDVPALGKVDDSFYPLLGYHIGSLAGRRVPLIRGLEHAAPSLDDLKAFGAAFATTSAAPLFHIAGVTPEALDPAEVLSATSRCRGKASTPRGCLPVGASSTAPGTTGWT